MDTQYDAIVKSGGANGFPDEAPIATSQMFDAIEPKQDYTPLRVEPKEFGKYKYIAIYEGEWHNNMRHGMGFERYADGSVYFGKFKKDRPHGKGEYFKLQTGDLYTGEWYQGMKHGHGAWERKGTLMRYTGQW